METTRDFFQDDTGASSVEYALLITLIAVVCISGMELLGASVTRAFTKTAALFP